MSESKVWKCANGHTLGMVIRNSSRVQQLLLFRQAAAEGCEGEVIAVVEGKVLDVRCSVSGCGCARTWFPDRKLCL